ncbi:MAG: hypothetical protein KAS78_05020 [Candidatus Pacebacteria bacterium]|nr:hypothetical protein [Candidatus Paceibacterota bacterium]
MSTLIELAPIFTTNNPCADIETMIERSESSDKAIYVDGGDGEEMIIYRGAAWRKAFH